LHDVAGAVALLSNTAQLADEYVTVNGTLITRYRSSLTAGAYVSMPFNALALLNPGDVVAVQIFPFNGPVTISGGSNYTHGYLTFTPVPEATWAPAACGLAAAPGFSRRARRRRIACG